MIRATFPLSWTSSDNDVLLSHLAILDSDLSQAIQSCKEEVASGLIQTESEFNNLRVTVDDLYRALEDSRRIVASWGGEYCFDRVCFLPPCHVFETCVNILSFQGYLAVEYWRRTLKF